MSKAFWAVYPMLVFFVVVVTANHFWLDAAAGALVAGLAALIAGRVLAPRQARSLVVAHRRPRTAT